MYPCATRSTLTWRAPPQTTSGTMRKSSSFMCVLVCLLAGGAEAQRPIASELLKLSMLVSMMDGASAWARDSTCTKFKDIYSDGEDLIERMWNNAFKYTLDEANAYTMWWFEGGAAGKPDIHDNPNDAITRLLGNTVPNQCHLDYFHKDAPTAEGADFTECHPWHASSCCHEATVVTPQALSTGYGPGYEWDRCGPLSQACERFFVQEACFYECEVNAGLYRKYTDAQHAACSTAGVAVGATVTVDGAPYTCTPNWDNSENAENKWQLWHMPIKASFADAWHRACANDFFCGDGDFFSCANDYHAQVANDAVLAANSASLALSAAEEEAKKLPGWAAAVIAIASALALLLLLFVCHMARKEKQGSPIFTNLEHKSASRQTADQPAANL